MVNMRDEEFLLAQAEAFDEGVIMAGGDPQKVTNPYRTRYALGFYQKVLEARRERLER